MMKLKWFSSRNESNYLLRCIDYVPAWNFSERIQRDLLNNNKKKQS